MHQAADPINPPSAIRRPRSAGGYSLVEMLVVLAIIVILSSTLMSAYGRFQRNAKLTTSVDKVISTLALARSLAISNNAIYHVRLDSLDREDKDLDGNVTEPKDEPVIAVHCYPNLTKAFSIQTPPDPASADKWNHFRTLVVQRPGPPATTETYTNYSVEAVELDKGIYLGIERPQQASDDIQSTVLAFYPDGTTNQTSVFTLFVTEIEKLSRPVTNRLDRYNSFNELPGATHTRANVYMIDVLPGGIIRMRKEKLP